MEPPRKGWGRGGDDGPPSPCHIYASFRWRSHHEVAGWGSKVALEGCIFTKFLTIKSTILYIVNGRHDGETTPPHEDHPQAKHSHPQSQYFRAYCAF